MDHEHGILLVTRTLPHPPTTGGQQRTSLLCRALCDLGSVALLLLRPSDGQERGLRAALPPSVVEIASAAPRARGKHAPWRAVRWLAPRVVDRVAHNLGRRSVDYRPDAGASRTLRRLLEEHDVDLVVGRSIEQTARSGALACNVPVVIDVDDHDPEVYRSRLEVPGLSAWKRVLIRHQLRQVERIVPRVTDRARHLWVASDSDGAVVRHGSVSVLPNVPWLTDELRRRAPLDEADADPTRMLFVGAMSHRVNREGMEYFLERMWPSIKSSHPDATLEICGSGLTDAMRMKWNTIPGVEATGFVPDLERVYARAAFSVVPLFEGGGTKIKLLESLALGRTTVVTRHAARGFERDLLHEDALLVAATPDDFAACCLRLLREPELRRRLALRGHAVVAREYSVERFARTVHDTCAELRRERH